MKLTAKQIRFIDEYLVDSNATQAAIRAGYSEKTAYQIGAENLRKPQIKAEIERRQKDLQRRTEVSQERVVKELARVAFANATDYAHVETRTVEKSDGAEASFQMVVLRDTAELSADQCAAIAGIKQGANGIEVKLCDKMKALELLGRHIGIFQDKISSVGMDTASMTFVFEREETE